MEHIISLSQRREDALQKILDRVNSNISGKIVGTKTKDELLRDWVLAPIQEQIRVDRTEESELIESKYEVATVSIQNQVKALLGIV